MPDSKAQRVFMEAAIHVAVSIQNYINNNVHYPWQTSKRSGHISCSFQKNLTMQAGSVSLDFEYNSLNMFIQVRFQKCS
ncbi:hypothetical protein SZ66_22730 [Pantoea ananatis]|nr:hypothetical protein [Pantoea ananatis]MDC7861891.1 hypothetical protein [Pantoea ananatis]